MGCSLTGLVYSYMRFSDPRQASGHSSERQMAYAAQWVFVTHEQPIFSVFSTTYLSRLMDH